MELAEILHGLVFASSGDSGLDRTATWILSISNFKFQRPVKRMAGKIFEKYPILDLTLFSRLWIFPQPQTWGSVEITRMVFGFNFLSF